MCYFLGSKVTAQRVTLQKGLGDQIEGMKAKYYFRWRHKVIVGITFVEVPKIIWK